MYVIRRHSRKLFFPAGLLALAWLPVLGGALLAARPEMRPRQRVLPLHMLPLQPSLEGPDGQRIPGWAYASPSQLDTLPTWQTVQFTGNIWQDDWSTRTASFVAQQLRAAPNQDLGLRIQFGPLSRYRSLVAMLNMFQATGLEKYWLDVRHQPASLNTFTEAPAAAPVRQPNAPLPFICGGVVELPAVPPPPLHVELTTLGDATTWQTLLASGWRYATLLLLLLPLAAAWQLHRLQTANSRR